MVSESVTTFNETVNTIPASRISAKNGDANVGTDSNPEGRWRFVRFDRSESSPLQGGGGSICNDKNEFKFIVVFFIVLAIAMTIGLIIEINFGPPQVKPEGSVISDNKVCSDIGLSMIKRGGNSIDAIIATTICLTVTEPYAASLGGGGFLAIHQHKSGNLTTKIIDFRETAPANLLPKLLQDEPQNILPGLKVGVPGLLRGLGHIHQKYGKIPWRDLLTPSVGLAKNGATVSPGLVKALAQVPPETRAEMNKLFTLRNDTKTNELKVMWKDLPKTLEQVATWGYTEFYKGKLGEHLVEDITKHGGLITFDDLANYSVVEREPVEIRYNNFRVITSPAPSGGPALLLALHHLTAEDSNSTKGFQPISKAPTLVELAEALKKGGGEWSLLGDPTFEMSIENLTAQWLNLDALSHQLQTHIVMSVTNAVQAVAVDSDELYVSLVTGLGSWFGSQFVTGSGILLNDAMLSFAKMTDIAGVQNKPQPGKRPLSTSCPVIVIDFERICGMRAATGSGDFQIATQVVASMAFDSKNNVTKSVGNPRLHVLSDTLLGDEDVSPLDNTTLQLSGGDYELHRLAEPYPTSHVIAKVEDELMPVSDPRGGNGAAVLD